MANFLRSAFAVFGVIALVVCHATLAAAPQQPAAELPVSIERIKKELEKPGAGQLKLDMPLQVPVARFKSRVDQRVYVLTLQEWIDKEFKLTALQRQSAQWAGWCCHGYVLASGSSAVGIKLDPSFKSVRRALERRQVRKIRQQIARDLAQIEAARKHAGLPDKRN